MPYGKHNEESKARGGNVTSAICASQQQASASTGTTVTNCIPHVLDWAFGNAASHAEINAYSHTCMMREKRTLAYVTDAVDNDIILTSLKTQRYVQRANCIYRSKSSHAQYAVSPRN